MTTRKAIAYLKKNQPIQNEADWEEEDFEFFHEMLLHFIDNYVEQCVPLLLNCFGAEWSDDYLYEGIVQVLNNYPGAIVMPAVCAALTNPLGSVQYWVIKVASGYKHRDRTPFPLLCNFLLSQDFRLRARAIRALGCEPFFDEETRLILARHRHVETHPQNLQSIDEILAQ